MSLEKLSETWSRSFLKAKRFEPAVTGYHLRLNLYQVPVLTGFASGLGIQVLLLELENLSGYK